ncbi:hypothetical protein [Pseudofulvibacter geojedonensis]|uniref:YARHG domain-containing protein n=1 Tax=Pseudofulvibacter geojedonensis TaxID=1123758 RepID=A0ABW3I5G2_9FLAO
MKYLTLVFFFSFLSFSQNQEAKIFFNDGETFEGFASITGNNKIKFRLNLEDEPTKFSSNEISRVEFYGLYTEAIFEYVKLNNQYNLLQVLTEGEVTLYAEVKTSWSVLFLNLNTFGAGQYSDTNFFTLYLINKKFPKPFNKNPFVGWKKKMMEYFSDCDELVRKIKANEFNRNDLKEIVEYYNDFCTDL